jgi:hypothetical protein
MAAPNEAAALAADAGVEESGARSGDVREGAAPLTREEPSLSEVVSDRTAELQPPKKKGKRSQQRKALAFMVEYLAKFGLQVGSRNASSGAVASVSCRFCLRFGSEA